jgi:hypothetical protein
MDTIKTTFDTPFGRKPVGPKVRYGVVAAGWISQSSFMPGVGQTSNSGNTFVHSLHRMKR